jgi:ribonuclease J
MLVSNGLQLKDIHTSGHAEFKTLNKIVVAMKPKTIIPIHTEAAESYKALFPDNSILVAEDGKTINKVNEKGVLYV